VTPTVTVGVPVYRGERFVAATLRSLQAQTFGDFAALLSLDGPQPAAEAACRPFLADPRFHLVGQPRRRGWVGNANWLMGHAATPYFCLLPQDDLIDPPYLEILLDHARRAPEAAVVYCDIQGFGRIDTTAEQPSVTGDAVARQLALLEDHLAAVAWRGLSRMEALRATGGIPANRVDGVAADTVWMAAAARWGELHRVPRRLYRKRYHDANEHKAWSEWPLDKRMQGWAVHCAAMLDQALRVPASTTERRALWLAAVGRLVSWRHAIHFIPVRRLTPRARACLVDLLFAEIEVRGVDLPGLLETKVDALRRQAVGHVEGLEAAGGRRLRRGALLLADRLKGHQSALDVDRVRKSDVP
jgi:GT2 family glycosyltransferase